MQSNSNRQRVSVACMACRAKRMRPICGPCARKALECIYQHTENKRRPPSKKYVESLQARIWHLESQLMLVDEQKTFGSNVTDTIGPEHYECEDEGEDSDDDHEDPFSELTGLVGRLAVVDDGQLHYFGSQSSLNLPKQPPCATTVPDPWTRIQSQGLAAAAQLGALINVPNELEEHLLDLYWRWQNPWNYIVDKSAFLKSRQGLDDGRYCSPLLLSAIFAISARYSDRPELRTIAHDPSTSGNAFCEQAKILLLYESEAPSVTTVQAAAILALRIMSDGKEALGWLYCGNAIRMAHNLGLHIDCSAWVAAGLISEEEAEVRKVTWWGCFVVDNYAPNSKFIVSDIEGIVTKADMDLRTYYRALPSHLRLPCSPKTAALPHVYLSQYVSSFDSSDMADVYKTPYQNNRHMEICRYSATQIAKLMQRLKQHYTLRQIPIAAVHLSFAAAVILLIDAHPANPDRNQSIRDLELCVDALRDLRKPWCAWADRYLRSVNLLALDWYRCNDIMQLKSYHEHRHPLATINDHRIVSESAPVPQEEGQNDKVENLCLKNTGEISITASNTEIELHCYSNRDVADTLAFLFQHEAMESNINEIAMNWLAEGWYSWLPNVPDI
ncbi:hypothetical protein KCU91_g4687, partial [Aureobasidium melanogenum]